MQDWLLPLLCCPIHRGPLVLEREARRDHDIVSGALRCSAGACEFPIRDSIADFATGDRYVESFSTQRKLLRRVFEGYKGDYSGDDLFAKSRIPMAEFRSGVTLDAGCGYGRYCNAISAAGGRVVGVDLSLTSLGLVRDAIGDRPGVCLVRADLYELPFVEGAFDRAISIGVLHHTPSTREAFRRVNRLIRTGGKCCIYVYENFTARRKIVDFHRRWATRIPEGLLIYLLSANQILLHWVRRIPLVGRIAYAAFPCNTTQRRWRTRLTADFDTYAPTFAHSHAYDEVFDWFVEDGFGDIQIGRGAVIWMTGTRRTAGA